MEEQQCTRVKSKDMEAELKSTTKPRFGLGFTENRRHEADDLLDRQTRDYIRSRLEPEDPVLESLGQVVKQARVTVTSSRQFLEQSAHSVSESLHRLNTYRHAPRGWFLDLCLGHELYVPLVPTFPARDPCREVREAAGETLFLQFCVDEYHVPAQLIVREVRVQCLSSHGRGDTENTPVASDTLEGKKMPEGKIQFQPEVLPQVSSSNTDSTIIQEPTTPVVRTCRSTETVTLSTEKDSEGMKRAISNTCQLDSCVPSPRTYNGPASVEKKYHSSPRTARSSSEITQVSGTRFPEARTRQQRTLPMPPVEASESTLSYLPGSSTSGSGLPDDPTSGVSQITSSLGSLQVDPMIFASEVNSFKDSSQNAATSSTHCTPSRLPHSKVTDIEKNHDFVSSNSLSDRRSHQETRDEDFHLQENAGSEKIFAKESTVNDVRILRESKEALIPELSEDRVLIRGHYMNTVTGEALPFTVFVHKGLQAPVGPSQLRLCGSYIRAMLTVKKNLRWRFQHTNKQ